MSDQQIKHMVDRFLGWRLPDSFNPDCGISFKRTHSEHGPFGPQKYEPSGTNLFCATEADAMVRYMLEGLPKPIAAVAERADFGPAYNGEAYVTITFRIPKETGAVPGIWELRPIGPGTLPWAEQKNQTPDEG